jgi:hypothetical protein
VNIGKRPNTIVSGKCNIQVVNARGWSRETKDGIVATGPGLKRRLTRQPIVVARREFAQGITLADSLSKEAHPTLNWSI